MERLPLEILTKILSYLSDKDQIRCETVCKKWFNIFKSYWKEYDGFCSTSNWRRTFVTISQDGEVVKHFCSRRIVSKFSVSLNIIRPNPEQIFKWCIRQGGISFNTIKINDAAFEDSAPFIYMIETCKNLQSLSLNHVTFNISPKENFFSQLISIEKLTHLFIRNCINKDFRLRNKILPSTQSYLTHLLLESFPINELDFDFIFLCQFIGNTLHSLCLKWLNINTETLMSGLQYLVNIKNLNLGHVLDSLGDEHLSDLARNLQKIEILSLTSQYEITAAGVNYLLVRCAKLTHLDLRRCSLIDDKILESLKHRQSDLPMLTIYAFDTKIIESSNFGCQWKIVFAELIDGVFFGDEEVSENAMQSYDGSGWNCDNFSGSDYDFDNDSI